MERILIRMLFVSCLAAAPFVLKRKHLLMYLTVFFAKGVLSSSIDSIFVKRNKIEYPVRPFPKTFDTNILYDLLFYPLLSVIWVRWTYHSKPVVTMMRSLCFSVPMSVAQWIMEKRTNLFKWRSWSILHTFASINFTLFAIRGLVSVVSRLSGETKPSGAEVNSRQHQEVPLSRRFTNVFTPVRLPALAYAGAQRVETTRDFTPNPSNEPSIDFETADMTR